MDFYFHMFRASSEMPGWCRSQYLIPRHLTFAREVRRQLVGTCDSAGNQVDICRPCHSTAVQLIFYILILIV